MAVSTTIAVYKSGALIAIDGEFVKLWQVWERSDREIWVLRVHDRDIHGCKLLAMVRFSLPWVDGVNGGVKPQLDGSGSIRAFAPLLTIREYTHQ